jgi:hypothetical protein
MNFDLEGRTRMRLTIFAVAAGFAAFVGGFHW